MVGPNAHAREVHQALKGLLVILMLVYHAMSIASQAGPEAFRPLRFVTGAFIFLVGDSLGRQWVSVPKDSNGPSASRRGLRLVALFLGLNAMMAWSGWGNPDKQAWAQQAWPHVGDRWWAALVMGESAAAAFAILWPIGVLLLCAPVLQWLGRKPGAEISGACLMGLCLVAASTSTWAHRSGVLEMLLVGGTAMGLAASRGLFTRKELQAQWPGFVSPGWAVVTVALGLHAVMQFPNSLTVYILGTAAILKGLQALLSAWHFASTRSLAGTGLQSALQTLGRMTLWAYVAQIVLIQALRWAGGGARLPLGLPFWGWVTAIAVLLWALCTALWIGRQQSVMLDRAYRWVFP